MKILISHEYNLTLPNENHKITALFAGLWGYCGINAIKIS